MKSSIGRRVVLTGAASGIGRATARLLVEREASLFLVDRDEAGLRREGETLKCDWSALDLTDHSKIPETVARAADRLGGIDAIINAAGIAHKREVDAMTRTDWSMLLDINLLAPFWLIQACLPHLAHGIDPAIVNVSSGTALRPTIAGYSAYAATKGGLITMSKALAFELAPKIRVNTVCPGATESAMLTREGAAMASGPNSPYALQRSAKAEEVAEAIIFLASPESSYITGSTLAVDGGRTFY